MGCPVSRSGRKGKGRTYLVWILVAGKGLGEDVTNGTAGRPVGTAREGRTREETVREKGKGGGRKKLEEMSLRPSLRRL